MVFTETELAYLASQRLGRLATAQPNGTLQVSPVGFSYNGATATIDISGFNLETSQKFRNIAENGRAAFVVDDLARSNPGASDVSRSVGWPRPCPPRMDRSSGFIPTGSSPWRRPAGH